VEAQNFVQGVQARIIAPVAGGVWAKAAGRRPNNRRLAARAPLQAFSAAVIKAKTAGIAAIR